MTRTLELKINCGEKTCASKPGEFCRFFLHSFGTPSCFLFGTLWDDEDGVRLYFYGSSNVHYRMTEKDALEMP